MAKNRNQSRILEVGVMLTIRQGEDSKTIEVIALSEKRQGAPEAQLLYSETEQSVEQREKKSSERSAFYGSMPASMRPNKKQRRQIHHFIKI